MSHALYVIGDVTLLVGAIGGIVFATSYAAFFQWRKTPAGRALFYFVASLSAVFFSNLAARAMGYDYPLREWFRLAVYATVTFTIWRLVIVLWRYWRTDTQPLDEKHREKEDS